jgi:benzoate/toluate 1,2-dioxygenase beta subunit
VSGAAPAGDLETLFQAQRVLYREARLLDEQRFDDWLRLFTEDARYCLPIRSGDLPTEPALVREGRAGMEERVFRLTRTLAHAQNPPSRTQHDVTNVEVVEHADNGDVVVLCNQTVHELRSGDVMQVGLGRPRVLAARSRYVLVPDAGWRIREKRCELIDRDCPLYNLTFIF